LLESKKYFIATMEQTQDRLFVSDEQSGDGPSKKDNQKNNKLSDQFGVHKSSIFSKAGDDLNFFLK
jgi:hypothetical protein